MWARGRYSTTTPARPRRPCRPRHLFAVPRTSLPYVCTRRRNCIEQSSPCPEYAPGTARFPASNPATIKLSTWRLVEVAESDETPHQLFDVVIHGICKVALRAGPG